MLSASSSIMRARASIVRALGSAIGSARPSATIGPSIWSRAILTAAPTARRSSNGRNARNPLNGGTAKVPQRVPQHEIDRIKTEISLQRLIETQGIELKKHGADLRG